MILDFLITYTLFNITVALIPIFLISYILLRICNSVWLTCASILHPDVEFLKYSNIRTLLDTHRNQGIISVLLSVKGQPQPEAVRRHLQELVRRRDKTGNLAFPRLRHCLVTKCGMYAWQKGKFDLDQNVTTLPFMYKGRAVTDYNIQEYVSEVVSKYLSPGLPPWQIAIIPTSEDHHYILLKLHHVLLSENLNIGDLLPLIPPTRQNSNTFSSKSPLVDVLKKPMVIPELKERLTDELSNRWNEFVSNHDPLERPELFKSTPSFLNFLSTTLITLVSLIKECRKGFRVIKSDAFSRLKYTFVTLRRETNKRQVTPEMLFFSIATSLDPRNFLKFLIKQIWFFAVVVPLQAPGWILAECMAIYACLTMQYCPYPHTFIGILYTYIPLLFNSAIELYYYATIIVNAPKNLVQDILIQKESLQTVTLCGRKSVAWSEPIKIDTIKTIARNTSATETDLMLTAVSASISKYFTQTNHSIPDDLPITLRNINSNYIFATGNNVKPEDSMSGILCMNLPIFDSANENDTILGNLMDVKMNFNRCLETQGLSHLLSMFQTKFGLVTKFLPSTLLAVYLKYLSRKYAVTVTEVTSRYPNVTQRTLWGQEVNDVVYWRPPQANTSISLCWNEYADHVKLGVMCDAQLVPHHSIFARAFNEYIQEIGQLAGVQH